MGSWQCCNVQRCSWVAVVELHLGFHSCVSLGSLCSKMAALTLKLGGDAENWLEMGWLVVVKADSQFKLR